MFFFFYKHSCYKYQHLGPGQSFRVIHTHYKIVKIFESCLQKGRKISFYLIFFTNILTLFLIKFCNIKTLFILSINGFYNQI